MAEVVLMDGADDSDAVEVRSNSQRYQPRPEATAQVRKYAEDPDKFPLNVYCAFGTQPTRLDPDSAPDRIRLNADHSIHDSQPHLWAMWRHAFAFGVAREDLPRPEAVAEHAAVAAARAMCVRVCRLVDRLDSIVRVPAQDDVEGQVEFAALRFTDSPAKLSAEDLVVVCGPARARTIASSRANLERWRRRAVALITDQRNPNRKYGLAPTFGGVRLVVENTVRAAGGDRAYAWPDNLMVLACRHPERPTFKMDFHRPVEEFEDRMYVETADGPDGPRGCVTEDYVVHRPDPAFAVAFVW